MNIATVLKQQGVYSPELEHELEAAIRSGELDIPRNSVPTPIDIEELEWLRPLSIGGRAA